MSSLQTSPEPRSPHLSAGAPRLHPEIAALLAALRRRIRRYVVVEGVSAVLVVVCGLFWFSYLIDAAHFEVRKLELPGWFRMGFTVLFAVALAGAAFTWVAARVMRSFRSRALALVLEKRFPQLGDRLITAVELSGGDAPPQSALGGAMLEQTMADAVRETASLDLANVFDPGPIRRWLTMAVVLVASVVFFGVTNASAMERWFNAYILGRPDYWEPFRRSAMTVRVLAQPGDRSREFGPDRVHKHPRGGDLTLIAETAAGRVTPERVTLHYRAYGGNGTSRGSVSMSPMAERQFRHVLSRVIDPLELWVVGGDFVNREPYRIEIVEPPRIDRLVLHCDYPDYTGMDAMADKAVDVQGTQVSLPLETAFVLEGHVNKPLRSVQVRCEAFDFKFGYELDGDELRTRESTLTVRGAEGESPRIVPLASDAVAALLSPRGGSFRIPFVLATAAPDRLAALPAGADLPLPLPADMQLQIYLEDDDDIISDEPALLTINGVVDQDPVVDTRLRGVSSSITRLAGLPVEGTITDDYGVAVARFGYRVDDEVEYSATALSRGAAGETEFTLGAGESQPFERFNVVPLELRNGQKLTLTLFAEDGDNLNGPHVSHGEVYSFKVVPPEELLGLLYDREVNLRDRFGRIIEEVEQIRGDLQTHRGRYEEWLALKARSDEVSPEQSEALRQIQVAIAASAERNLHLVRKSHTETAAVEASFRAIREEMVNNRVDTATNLERIDARIINPLQEINGTDFPGIDQQIGLFHLANEQGTDPRPAVDSAIVGIEGMLTRMREILAVLQERGNFNAAIKELQEILSRARNIRDQTRKEQEQKLFDLLK